MKFLTVDDQPANLRLLRAQLEAEGHDVVEASNGYEALRVLERIDVDGIISDILMPEMDGFRFCLEVRKHERFASLPFVLYTSTYDSAGDRALAKSVGADSYIVKPAPVSVILEALTASTRKPRSSVMPLAAEVDESHVLKQYSEALVNKLAEKAEELQLANQRLSAVTELNLELASERDPQTLLAHVCSGVRRVFGARYAVLAVKENTDGAAPYFTTSGIGPPLARILTPPPIETGLLGRTMIDRKPYRMANRSLRAEELGLPRGFPDVRSVLACPIASLNTAYGWVCLIDKVDVDAFTAEEERVLSIHAAQVGRIYENSRLYAEIEHHAAQLELEVSERKRVAEGLRASELRFRQLAENVREVFILIDAKEGTILYVSPAYESVWGRSCASLYADSRSWMNSVHPDDRESVRAAEALLSATGHFDMEYRIVRLDRSTRWVWTRMFPIRDESSEIYRLACVSEDITERKEREQKIARLTRIHAVLSAINSAIVRVHDRELLFREACRIAVDEGAFRSAWIAEIDPDTLDGRVVAWSGDHDDSIDEAQFSTHPEGPSANKPASRAAREMRSIVYNDVTAEPTLAPLWGELLARGHRSVAAFPIIVEGKAAAAFVLYAGDAGFFDDEELQLLEELAGDIAFALGYVEKEARLNYLAYFDALTGLPNSMLFRDRLAQFLDGSERDGRAVALFLIDLDRFTHLNDTLGRRAGDTLLRLIAERLDVSLPKPSSLARISADTFAVAVAELGNGANDAASILENYIFAPLDRGFVIRDRALRVTARAGIALFPGDGPDADALFKNAETALKQAKASSDAFMFYASEMNTQMAEKVALEDQLRKAQAAQQFVLHFQPKVELATGRIVGCEALIRWQNPALGLLYPGRFISVAEESELIISIGEWALRTACVQTKAWHDAGLPPVTVSVNLSPRQFKDEGLVNRVAGAIKFAGLDPRSLELELTENIVMTDPEQFIVKLEALKELGVKMSLDDFGTGYSSLSYLKRFPLDLLKVDQSFIREVTTNPDDAAIVRAIISVGHSLGLDVVAEGVETPAQLAWLRRERCDQVQGYQFSHPVSAPEFQRLLREQKDLPSVAMGTTTKAKTLLIVDDEADVSASLVRVLSDEGYRILTAHNANEAFDVLAQNTVHVVISDHRMPVMTGAEFLGKVKALYPETVRILSSGYVELNALTDAVNRGAVFRLLLKPWDDDLLRESIREAFHYYWLTHTESTATANVSPPYEERRSGAQGVAH
jgi:diguanylate cyclase (GGDEF)-like protein/PAS domain S-box-containing protein